MIARVLAPALLALAAAAPASASSWLVESTGKLCHPTLSCPDSKLSFVYDDVTGGFSDIAWDMRYYDSRGFIFHDVKFVDSPVLVGLMDEGASDGVLLESIQSASLLFNYVFYSAAGQDYAGAPGGAPNPTGAISHYQEGAPVYAWGAALDWDPAMTLDDGTGDLAFFVRWNDGVAAGAGTYFGIGGATATMIEAPETEVPIPAAGGLLAAALAGFAALRRRG